MKYSQKMARQDLPRRLRADNKTRGGKCLVVAGSKGLFGAAILCCQGASRSGAGYTYLKTTGSFPVWKHPDFLLCQGKIIFSDYQAVAIGPGLLEGKKIHFYLQKMRQEKVQSAVLDAGAIRALASRRYKLPKTWIVTPHEGELSQLLQVSSPVIRKNREKFLLLAQKRLGCIVLLKGFRTLVADGNSVWEIPSGNPALAKAGTGDVLTGIIAGLLSQKVAPLRAALLGAYVHGRVADEWIQAGNDSLSLMASDIIERLPKSMAKIRD